MKSQANSSPSMVGPVALGHELVKAKEIINEFAYSCSHSMRGPLKSISGLIHLLNLNLDSGTEDPKVYLKMISQSVLKMECLLLDLEQFLENSKKDLTSEPINIQHVVADVLEELGQAIKDNHIGVTTNIEQSGFFYTDVHRFRIILFHLISNAVTFCDETKKSKRIEVHIKATSSSCSLQINDNGIGIASEIQNKIFDLFYRGSEKSAGSGVGLHIVNEVLKKMGGSISVNSEGRQGANFFVWLPNTAI